MWNLNHVILSGATLAPHASAGENPYHGSRDPSVAKSALPQGDMNWRMLALHKSLKSAHNPQEADRLTREVEAVDKSIDGLVYELYGLTEEEIKIIEGK